jgi:hypothetical protein
MSEPAPLSPQSLPLYARVCDVCRHGLLWYDTVGNLNSANAISVCVPSYFGADQRERVAKFAVDRSAHYGIVLAWDAFQAQCDAYYFAVSGKDTKGKPTRDKAGALAAPVLDSLSPRRQPVGECIESLVHLRNMLTHSLGHTDDPWIGSPRPEHGLCFSGPAVRLSALRDPRIGAAAVLRDSTTVLKPFSVRSAVSRHWVAVDRTRLEELLTSIQLLAWLTMEGYERGHRNDLLAFADRASIHLK